MKKVIEVHNLKKTYQSQGGWWRRSTAVEAVKGISFELFQGETLAVVGESGSGKSTLARMLVGLESPTSGTLKIQGEEASVLAQRGVQALGKTIQYVFQDPVASLNPRKTIGQILRVPLQRLCGYRSSDCLPRMQQLLTAVNMPHDALNCYPHEFSGGQAQRLAIARALAAEAQILVLDEPVSALDVSVQAQVLLLLEDLKQQFALSYLFISHDLAVVESIADRVAVMNSGTIVECAATQTLFSAPEHDYSRQLLASAPVWQVTPPVVQPTF
ncbi:ATP-binding cassette domain-containing protein [Erwinia sorbitola]|uniref:ATP-binding cassette domain-containing protein n=1 Tax=Erwinia sorbitola TaxID=2681984 RepID=A0A6I6EI87_9GAMM|nr:ATP-binding cassette domain-containing protein [Erwinia sorbitola]QGU88308.1 ATP-binding cassette domain-containing protein [Erwinia sorbitola]